MPIPSPGYLAGALRLCHERGARLILDEVQAGLGRTGRLWAYQHDGVTPDVVVTGKGLGGGVYPISATLMTRELHAFFDERPFVHISTFGGAELGCVAALATLDVVEAPGFLEHVTSLAARFAEGLAGLPFRLRQRGLMMGLEFAVERGGQFGTKALYDAGVFATWANNDMAILQLLPPLTLTDAQADELLGAIRKAFS
jgi:acetylornithine/succinyldiaminopimelate/putrescine aminotransferase